MRWCGRRWGCAVLVLGVLWLAGCSNDVVPQEDPTATSYEPTSPQPQEVGARLVGPLVYTVDARSRDVWMYFDFARGSVVAIREPRTESWDLAFQRYVIRTNGGQTNPAGQGALLRLNERALGAVPKVPDQAEFVSDIHPKNRPSSYNPLTEKWFNYSYLANVLAPKPVVYVVRTHDGKYAKMRLLSYYCTEKSAGCLTFEYVYQGDGSINLSVPPA
ncbi:MAG: HmuY family protein [Candidatus Tectimicrobiota bacterium]